MVCACSFDDELDAVAGYVWFEVGGDRGPDVGAGVGDVFGDGQDWNHVSGGAAEKEEGYSIWEVIIEVSALVRVGKGEISGVDLPPVSGDQVMV